MIRAVAVALVLTAACGGKKPAPVTSAPTPTEHGAEADHREAIATMPPEIARFHELLSPLWHAEKGPQRMKDTCAALPEMHASGDALAKATPPSPAHADTWTSGTRSLVAAIAALDSSCKANDATTFETAFAKVHESFHGLMSQAGGHEEGHEGMDHGAMDHGATDHGAHGR